MKTFEQLAEEGYEAHQKEATNQLPGYRPMAWDSMTRHEKACWIAAAKQIVAVYAVVH
jgi:hypothetical protein